MEYTPRKKFFVVLLIIGIITILVSGILLYRNLSYKYYNIQEKHPDIKEYEQSRDKLTFKENTTQQQNVTGTSACNDSSSGFSFWWIVIFITPIFIVLFYSRKRSLIEGIISLTVVAIVFAQVLMPTLGSIECTTNTQYNTTEMILLNQKDASFFNVLTIILVVVFIFVLLAVFGIDR